MGSIVSSKHVPAWSWAIPLAWTLLVGAALWWNIVHTRNSVRALAEVGAKARNGDLSLKDYIAKTESQHRAELLAHLGAWMVGLLAFGVTARQILHRQQERDQAAEGLKTLATSFAHLSGKPFFEAVSNHLAKALGVDYVFVGELNTKRDAVTALGGYARGQPLQELTYFLAGTPCENVVATKSCAYVSGVQSLFPNDRLLVDMGIEGYLGASIFDKRQQPLGILVALHSKPLPNPAAITHLFSAFAERVSAEMQRGQAQAAAERGEERVRKEAEAALRESERKYRELVENANSIILRWNPTGEITFLNEFGQRFFGWSHDEILRRNVVGTIVPETESTGRDLRRLIGLICETPLSYQRNLNENILRDGRRVWIAWTNKAVFDAAGNLLEVLSVGTDVTERKEAEQALSESEARYRKLFSNNPHSMWVYDVETLAFLEVNEAAVSHYGYTREEFLGMTIADIRPPEDVPRLLENVAHVGNGIDHAGVWRHRKRDGSLMEVEITTHPLEYRGRRAELVLANDITERRRAEARYRSLFDNALEGIYQTTPGGTILAANPALARMLGYASPEELVREVGDLGNQLYADPAKRNEFRQTLEKHGTVTGFEHELVRKDGTRIWVSGNARAILDELGRITHYEGSMEDITQRKHSEQERQRLLAQLVQAQKMEAVGQLAGGVAHDFNNILASIILHTGLLRLHPNMAPEVRNALSELESEAVRAANLTRQLLMFSRRQLMQPQVLDLNSLLGNLLKMLRRLIGEHISLEFKGDADDLWVKADPGMLEQVVVNLVVNARDAMPQGGRLSIDTKSVNFGQSNPEDHPQARPGSFVCLSVSDSGSGMDEATIERIFEPFFTTKEPGKGTGLGLATVYGIVKQHDGWVEVRSALGKGSAFRVYLPAEPRATKKLHEPDLEEPTPGGHETVLVVEDEAVVRKTITEALRQRGYDVLEASDGLTALEIWLQHGGRTHLLLTDMVMPGGMSGLDLTERLRRDNPELKVLLISGYNVELAQHGLPAHTKLTYLAKPFDVRTLAETVRSALDGK